MSNFLEITSNDNWFKLHPEKIAGVEYETTSFYFPIMVRGTKEDVLKVTGTGTNLIGFDKEKNNKLIKTWQDFIREPLRIAIPIHLQAKKVEELFRIEKSYKEEYYSKTVNESFKKELLYKIWAISALIKAYDKAKTVNNYPESDNKLLYEDDERLIKILQAPEKAKIEKKREQLLLKVKNFEKRILEYEKVKKEAAVDYYDYIVLPDYKSLKKPYDLAYSNLKSFNRTYGYVSDNNFKEQEFIRKNEPKIDRTELLKIAISIQESRVKTAEKLFNESKKAPEKTNAMRDLQTEQSVLSESKAKFKIYNLKIAIAKAKAIKIKLLLK